MKSNSEKEISYAEAMEKLEHLVSQLQDPQCSIDSLRDYTAQSLKLLQLCKAKLTETDNELKKLLEELSDDKQ